MHCCAMREPAYRRAIENYIRTQAKPPDKFSHQLRLYQLAKQIAEGQPFDDEVLYAAASFAQTPYRTYSRVAE